MGGTCSTRNRAVFIFGLGNVFGRDHAGDLDEYGRIILAFVSEI
jgi:hypothetical protein